MFFGASIVFVIPFRCVIHSFEGTCPRLFRTSWPRGATGGSGQLPNVQNGLSTLAPRRVNSMAAKWHCKVCLLFFFGGTLAPAVLRHSACGMKMYICISIYTCTLHSGTEDSAARNSIIVEYHAAVGSDTTCSMCVRCITPIQM